MFKWTLSQEMNKFKIVQEAPDDTTIETGASSTDETNDDIDETDYDEAAKEMDDADQDGKADEGTETAEEESNEDLEAEDYGEEAESEDNEDETNEDNTGEEDTNEDEMEDEIPESNGDKKGNSILIKDFITLYYGLDGIIKKLNNNTKTNLIKNEIYFHVIHNLTDVNETLYEYIVSTFNNNSYVFNLYQFNLFLECIKINVEILKKCGELQSNKQTNK